MKKRNHNSLNNMIEESPLREAVSVEDNSCPQDEPLHNDFIPDELLATLTSTVSPQYKLRPLKLTKTPKDFEVCLLHRPDALWHHPAGRKKYQYFLNQPTSINGAGRDISFLCDALSQKDQLHLSPRTERGSAQDESPLETLIPEEYHIIKNKGLKGLQCYDDKFTILLEDDEKKLRVFPSMKPNSRLEVVQLMKVMDDMLEKAGVKQDVEELTEHSQMEKLLELVRIEQNIYNIVFHELIRQVSVECAERGLLLAKLRQRYAALLDRIPRQVKGLHAETLAQRALDRRLTEGIMHFKNSVAKLNTELSVMKVQDESLSKEAEETKEELAKALEESQCNANIVAEFHDLYELQRRRLEAQMFHLSDERDLWRKATYSLAIKIVKINKLQLVKRLNISEQTWAKTAEHFTLILTSKDSEDMSHITELTDQWKDKLTVFMQDLRKVESSQCETMQSVRANVVKWQKICEDQTRKIDKSSEEELSYDLKQWSMALIEQSERYGGEELVSAQEPLEMLTNLQESWIEVCLRVFRRHPALDGGPPKGQETMTELAKTITELHKQLGIRISGESGIHATLMSLIDNMEIWSRRLKSHSEHPERHQLDWVELEEALGRWINQLKDALLQVDGTQPERERAKQKPHTRIQIDDVLKTLKEFLFSQENFFDCENMRLREEVNSVHSKMIRWMVDILVLMVPDDWESASPLLPELNITVDVSAEQLGKDASDISGKLDYLSKYMTSSCQAIVEEQVLQNSTHHDTENELHRLAKLQKECGEWMEGCRVLLLDVKGSPVEISALSVPQSVSEIPLEDASMETLQEEELEAPTETKEDDAESSVTNYVSKLDEYGEDQDVKAKESSVIKLIGHDGNITERILDTVQLTGTEELVVSPHTENAKEAFNALETVRSLQQELLEVETRAALVEARAQKAEEDLLTALDKIQDLERQLQARSDVESTLSKTTVTPSTPAASSKAKTRSRKAESSPKGNKRH